MHSVKLAKRKPSNNISPSMDDVEVSKSTTYMLHMQQGIETAFQRSRPTRSGIVRQQTMPEKSRLSPLS